METDTAMKAATWDALPAAIALGRRYDVPRLADEVRRLRDQRWLAQRSIGQGGIRRESTLDWTILPLRSPGGDPTRTDPGGAGLLEHADTPYLSRAPYLAEVLRGIPAPLLSVRLMALGPGTRIGEHRDVKCGLPWGVVRLHLPIITNPGALVTIDGHSYHWDAGRLWFGDFNRLHQVGNDGTESRIHLVLDCLVSRELLELFPHEVTRALPSDEIVLARPQVALSAAESEAMRCRFSMPARFAEWAEMEPTAGPGETVPAEVMAVDDRLVLAVAGEPAFGLVHLGAAEFRLAGWTQERTLRLELDGGEPAVRFLVRAGRATTESVQPATRLPAR